LSKSQTIKINWEMTDPPVPARRWRDLAALEGACQAGDCAGGLGAGGLGAGGLGAVPGGAPAEATIETTLGFPAGTIRALHGAFAAGLTRFDGWDASGSATPPIAASKFAAAKAAARIYKRGVPWRGDQPEPRPAQLHGSYQVTIYPDSVDLTDLLPHDVDYVIIDGNVARSWGGKLWPGQHRNPSGPKIFEMQLSENEKTLASVANILEHAPSPTHRVPPSPTHRVPPSPASTRWCVIGGGILTDVAAFAAGIKGAEITFVPTTLLAMADACIGGKTGVNFSPWGKNQLGLFYFPREVRVWPGWLQTLPPRHLAAGVAECIKHSLLDPGAFKPPPRSYVDQIADVIHVKANVVKEDPAETGRRATLNFGHTLAHALEAEALAAQERGEFDQAPDEQILHGEAVAVGLAFAVILSQMKCGLSENDKQWVFSLLRDGGCWFDLKTLTRRCGGASLQWDSLWRRMCGDKKQSVKGDDATEFVLLSKIGEVHQEGAAWTVRVSEPEAAAAWTALMSLLR